MIPVMFTAINTNFCISAFLPQKDLPLAEDIMPHNDVRLLCADRHEKNVDKIVETISTHNSRNTNAPYAASAANFHRHEYAHNGVFKTLDLMRGNNLSRWRYLYAPWDSSPIEIEQLFAYDVPDATSSYLVLRQQNLDGNWPEHPWCTLFRRLPDTFWGQAEKIATVPSYGPYGNQSDFVIYYLDTAKTDHGLLYDIAATAESVDREEFKPYQKLKKLYYGLKYYKGDTSRLNEETDVFLRAIDEGRLTFNEKIPGHQIADLAGKLRVLRGLHSEGYAAKSTYGLDKLPPAGLHQAVFTGVPGEVKSLGNDPILIYNLPASEFGHKYTLALRIEAPGKDTLQIFYKPAGIEQYTEARSQRCTLTAGSNECFFTIAADQFDGQLRIDPGTRPGLYRLKELIVMDFLVNDGLGK
jgi:hypothetical protein